MGLRNQAFTLRTHADAILGAHHTLSSIPLLRTTFRCESSVHRQNKS